jgi:PAS domain S-box-containing protein
VGNVQGGVSVALSLASLLTFERQANITSALTFGLLWLLGIGGIVMSGRGFNRHIGEHNRAVIELEQTLSLLQQERDMFISGPVVVFKWQNQENWPVEYVSANVAEILGYTAEGFMQGDVLYANIVHPEDIMRVADEVTSHSQNHTERFEHHPYRLVRSGGDIVWVLDFTTIVRDEAGNITHYFGYLVEITAQKRIEEALRESEVRYRQIFETNQAVKLIINPEDGRIVEANQAAVRFYGYDYATLTQMRIMDINILPETKVRQEMERARHAERLFFNFRHRLASGEIRDVEVYSGPVQTPQGELLYSIIQDVTERYQAEAALRESEERLEMALQGAGLGTWDWNVQTGEVVFNERWAEMLGYTLDEIESDVSSWERLMHPDEIQAVVATLTDHLEGRTPFYQTEHRLHAKSGEWRWILDTGKVVARDEAGHPVRAAGTHQDVTERKQIEQRLIRQERLAAVGQLAAGIAHDFNNILASVLLHADLLQRLPDTPETVSARLSLITTSGRRAANLVRQILDFSQKTMRQPQAIDLASFTEEIVQFLASTLPENIQIDLRIDSGDFLIEADPSQLQQVIINLAVNARYAMPGGGVLRIGLSRGVCNGRYRCEMCGQPITGEWVQLQVADTGSGIPANILPRIFEPFFTTREVGEGSGLGLSQVAGILAQHGGHTSVESEMKKGSTFTVYLPPSESAEKHVNPELAPVEEGHGETILLVEDDTAVMQATAATLEFLGYQVITAATGTEAIDLFDKHKTQIALVLSDMNLPDTDGAALFQHLKTKDPDLKMVVISGQRLGAREETLLAQGMVTWMQKPVSFDQLAQVVDKALASRRGRWD